MPHLVIHSAKPFPMKIGLIDIGSNTCKLLIAERRPGFKSKNLNVLEEISLPCRLFEVSPTENLKIEQPKLNRLIDCLLRFVEISQKQSVVQLKTVATEALRKAINSTEILEAVERKVGLKIQILSGEEEARAVAQGLQTDPIIRNWENFIAMDMGGGSTEFIEVKRKKIEGVKSLPLGAATVAYSICSDISTKITLDDQQKVRNLVQDALQAQLIDFSRPQIPLVATGGTIVFLRKILEQDALHEQPGCMQLKKIERLAKSVCSLSLDKRISHYTEIPSDRADIFPYGVLTLVEIMKFLGVDRLTHSFHNLRYGLVEELL